MTFARMRRADRAIQFCLHEKNVRSPAFFMKLMPVSECHFGLVCCVVLRILRQRPCWCWDLVRNFKPILCLHFVTFWVEKRIFFQCQGTSWPSFESSAKALNRQTVRVHSHSDILLGSNPNFFQDQWFSEKDHSPAWVRRLHTGDYEGRTFVITRTDELQSFVSIEKEMTNASCFAFKTCHKSSAF